jgi:hypothetical protein
MPDTGFPGPLANVPKFAARIAGLQTTGFFRH